MNEDKIEKEKISLLRRRRQKNKTKDDNPVTDYDENQLEMGDDYDIIKQTIKVNSPISTMNPDFIMADLDPKILDNQVVTYIRDHLANIEHINMFLNNIELEDEEYRKKSNQLILNKVYSLVNLSRPHDAKVINAILERIKTSGGQIQGQPLQPPEEDPNKPKFGGPLNPANWGRKQDTN